MREAQVIGAHLKIAVEDLLSAAKLGPGDRNSVQMLFQATENILMAVFTSEGIDVAALRRTVGNHQLSAMIDHLPAACGIRDDLNEVAILEAYATTYRYPTPSGRVPEAPEAADVEAWFEHLKRIAGRLCTHFKVDARAEQPAAQVLDPIR